MVFTFHLGQAVDEIQSGGDHLRQHQQVEWDGIDLQMTPLLVTDNLFTKWKKSNTM